MRANYNHLENGIHATTEYLEYFFENLLLGTQHELKNRYLVINAEQIVQSAKTNHLKCQNDTLNGTLDCTLEELAVINQVIGNPSITQKELTQSIGKSERTVKRIMQGLQQKGILERVNGKRNGKWICLFQDKK